MDQFRTLLPDAPPGMEMNREPQASKIGKTIYVGMPHRGKFADVPEPVRKAFHNPSLGDMLWIAHGKANSSEANYNYNLLWCNALNERLNHGVDEFAMLHDDVFVEPGWLDILRRERERLGVTLMAAVIPIKGMDAGITSTAWTTNDNWSPRRLTMKEVYQRPTSWTEPGLLANTGCMLLDFDRELFKDFCFEILHRRAQFVGPGGRLMWKPEMMAEDWNLSRYVWAHGGSVGCTTAVKLYHGEPDYHNHYAWGTWDVEQHGSGAPMHITNESAL